LLLHVWCDSQALVDAQATERLVANLRKRINGSIEDMRAVFGSFDKADSGVLPAKTFTAACAALGVVLSPQERAWVGRACAADTAGAASWRSFCGAFAADA
jgi:hypothetical protein